MELLSKAWRKRRWVYAAYMLFAVLRIPARVGFRLQTPHCDTRLSAENIAASLTKIPHIVLFGFFFLLTIFQFDRVNRGAFTWSFLATLLLGLIVELEEGATRTGNCRLTDLLPDALGALIVAAVVMMFMIVRRGYQR